MCLLIAAEIFLLVLKVYLSNMVSGVYFPSDLICFFSLEVSFIMAIGSLLMTAHNHTLTARYPETVIITISCCYFSPINRTYWHLYYTLFQNFPWYHALFALADVKTYRIDSCLEILA